MNRILYCFNAASDILHTFYCYWRHKFSVQALVSELSIFVYLTVTCSLTTHTKFTVAFPSQQWLGEHAKLLRYRPILFL